MTFEKSQAIQQLKASLELRTLKRDFLLYACCLGIPWLIMASDEASAGPAVLLGLTLLAILGFYLWRILCIFRNPEGYIFCDCVLNQVHSNPFLRSFFFTVRVEMPDGRTEYVDTHAIFATHGIFEPIMEDYVNSTVTIAYNPSTDMVVVIG